MSQFFKGVTSGDLPPDVPLQFTADDASTATPAANNLNVFGGISSDDNVNGIQTTATGSTVVFELTNRINVTAVTSDDTLSNVGTFALSATSGGYLFEGNVIGYNKTDNLLASYKIKSAVRTTSGTATLVSAEVEDVFVEGAMSGTEVDASVSGNNFRITLTGLAGKDINWRIFFQYHFVDGVA